MVQEVFIARPAVRAVGIKRVGATVAGTQDDGAVGLRGGADVEGEIPTRTLGGRGLGARAIGARPGEIKSATRNGEISFLSLEFAGTQASHDDARDHSAG